MKTNHANSEEEVLDGFRKGYEDSLSLLFKELYSALTYFSFGITHDLPASEDIATEAFVKIWDRRGDFATMKKLKSFLYNIVRNASLNCLRDEQRRYHKEQAVSLHNENVSTPFDSLVRAEVMRELLAAINSLPPQCRKVMTMLFLEGKDTRQVAAELRVTISAVKNRKAKGLALLRKHISPICLGLFYLLSPALG